MATIEKVSSYRGLGDFWWVRWGPGETQCMVASTLEDAEEIAVTHRSPARRVAEIMPLVSFRPY